MQNKGPRYTSEKYTSVDNILYSAIKWINRSKICQHEIKINTKHIHRNKDFALAFARAALLVKIKYILLG